MTTGGVADFRITGAFPGFPVDVPPVYFSPIPCRLDGPIGRLIIGAHSFRDLVLRELDHELVIRGLLDLDSSDDQDVLAFINAHGIIDKRADQESGLMRQACYDLDPDDRFSRIRDAAAYLWEVQTLALHFLAIKEGRDVLRHVWYPRGLNFVSDEEEASMQFVVQLNRGLRWNPVRLIAESSWVDLDGTRQFWSSEEPFQAVGLYSALCLQLFNLVISEEVPIRRCKRCGSAFSVQTGRAKAGQHRRAGDVKYCSSRCANAAAQQAFRERNKSKEA